MGLLFRIQFLKFRNLLLRSTTGETIKTASFAAIGMLFLLGLYFGFVRFLGAVRAVELVGPLLLVKILAMAFLTTFFMIVFSSTLTSFSTLFFARDLSMLIHTPLSYRTLFTFKSFETAVFASWTVVVALLPFLAAFGKVMGQGIWFYAALGALGIPFVWIASALGVGAALALMTLFPARRVREVMFALGILISSGLYLWLRWLAPAKFLRADSFSAIVQYVEVLEAPTAVYLPSWWLTSAVAAVSAGRWRDALAMGSLLAAVAVAVGAVLIYAGERAYYGGWARAQEGVRRNRAGVFGREWNPLPRWLAPKLRALLGKDLIIFRRDSNQWSQLLMLGSIVAIYLMSIRKLPLDTPFLRGLISFLNIGMVGFVMASVGLRFIFPEVSLEGRSWWVLRAAPMGLWSVLWGKFLLGFLPVALIGVTLVWASNYFLAVDPFVVWLSNITVLLMALAFAGLGVGFGALMPRFHEENVARIQTSAGGFLYMMAALFYVGLTLALEAVVMRLYYFSRLAGGRMWSWWPVIAVAAAVIVVNALAVAIPMMAGHANLRRADI